LSRWVLVAKKNDTKSPGLKDTQRNQGVNSYGFH